MFIEVTTVKNNPLKKQRLLNADKILYVRKGEDDETIIETTDNVYVVSESYEEIKNLLIPTKHYFIPSLEDYEL